MAGTILAERMIYGSGELAEAISYASQGNISIRVANQMAIDAYRSGGLAGIRQLASENGLTYITNSFGDPEWYAIGELRALTPTSAPTVAYVDALEATVDNVTDDVVLETAKQVATEGGSKVFTAGAVRTLTNAVSVVGAVATGVQLGWESYKEHPDFWTDLSESIFGSEKSPDGPIEVLARAHAGGYTTAVKERDVCKILQGLADQGAFTYRNYDSTITHAGIQDITLSEISPFTATSGLAYAHAQELYPDGHIIEICEVNTNQDDLEIAWVDVYLGALPTSGDVIALPELDTYYVSLGVKRITARRVPSSEYVTYSETSLADNIYTGRVIDGNQNETVGGLCVTITEHTGDNELFPDDGSPLQLAPNTPLNDIANTLKLHYPDWFNNSWEQSNYDPSTGEASNERYYPITIPWWDPVNDPNKDPNYDPGTARDGDIYPDSDPRSEAQGEEATKNNEDFKTDPDLQPDYPQPPAMPTPPDPGAGGGGASSNALWAVYNPTKAEINSLGGYLWSSSIVDILAKFIQNPMDAIISLHSIYCTPSQGTRQNIYLGYLDSGVTAITVPDQFTDIDCGSVTVEEFFGDARDYTSPYTTVEAYLPFVGIVHLKTEDIIGGKVNIIYTIDVYTGACLCKIFVTKLGAKQLLYTYSGNCSVQIPLTGADRTRMLSGALTGAISGAFLGAEVGAVAGAVMGAWAGGSSVERSSSFTANAGCLGVKKPYLIITRKYAYDAGYYQEFYGYPSNNTVTLSSCRGFTRVKSVHIDSIANATNNEKTEIEALLKEGVIIK